MSAVKNRYVFGRHCFLTGTALLFLGACGDGGGFDWDFRPGDLNTADAARTATQSRPMPNAQGIISYPDYQAAVARPGDNLASIAARTGSNIGELAQYNALDPNAQLREGEVVILPKRARVAQVPAITGGVITSQPIAGKPIDVGTIASGAIDRADQSAAKSTEPRRHKVKKGETAITIARSYNVSPKSLAEWNGLDSKMTVRIGQTLLVPVASQKPPVPATRIVTAPGAGSPTPVPPSASKPLPNEDEAPAASKTPAQTAPVADLGATRSGASNGKLSMPVLGKIIRPYSKGKNDGIDIGAGAGSNVSAADNGTVAAITKGTDGVPIMVVRHANNLLTVYGGIDNITVAKGAAVRRGQVIGKVHANSPSFVHFEVRRGFDSVDPMGYLN